MQSTDTSLGLLELWLVFLVRLGVVLLPYLRAYNFVFVLLAAMAATSHILLNRGLKSIENTTQIITPAEANPADFYSSITVINIASWPATLLILIVVGLARFKRYQFPTLFPYFLAPVLLNLAKTMRYQAEVTCSYEGSGWNAFESTSVPSTSVLFTLAFGLALLMSRPFNRWITFMYCKAALSVVFVPSMLKFTHFSGV
jgi:hypothetical protein